MQDLSQVEKKAIIRNRLKFTEMAKRINVYLKEENLCLNFAGYTDTINDYLRVTDIDIENLNKLSLELNLWSDYFGQLEGFIEMRMFKFENKLLYLQAFYDKKNPDKDLEPAIKEAKVKFDHYKLFLKHIVTQKKMFEKAYKYCLSEYDKALNNYIYKYND